MHLYISNLLYSVTVSAPLGVKISQVLDKIVKF